MDKLILICYINVGDAVHEQVQGILENVRNYVNSENKEYISLVVPVRNQETRFECLNPKFITSKKLIEKFEKDLNSVNKNFEKILNKLGPYKRKILIEKTKKYDK